MDMENVNMLDGITLAYVGDCVMELYVRKLLVSAGISGSRDLNNIAQKTVNAAAQADAYHRIENMLTDEESDIFKRGRNCGHLNLPKHAKMSDYRIATGLEALFGYLSLTGNEERLAELLRAAVVLPMQNEQKE
ncbi:MAG: Mini-ribonuclease 3 [Ruminococcaceae bacterium]|nr:Mini-ribonuclease 3 [Oscillospiraceae bacterium]